MRKVVLAAAFAASVCVAGGCRHSNSPSRDYRYDTPPVVLPPSTTVLPPPASVTPPG